MECDFISLFPPPDCKEAFLLPFEERSVHGGTHEPATNP
jgi:hypothetical protein